MFARNFVSIIASLAFTTILNASPALSDSERLLARIDALEARLAALETENRAYRREIKRTQAISEERVRTPAVRTEEALNRDTSTTPALASLDATRLNWSGGVVGVSVGGGLSRSQVFATDRTISTVAGAPPPFDTSGTQNVGATSPRNSGGALIDVFAGWNVQLGERGLIGAQLEGTLSQLDFGSSGLKTTTVSNSAGVLGQGIQDFRPTVESRWMASALVRAGIIVDDQTLLYGIGGWTVAEFVSKSIFDDFIQPRDRFITSGWTAGGGVERRLDSNWSVRAEYRYTDFGQHTLNHQFSFRSTSGTVFVTTQNAQGVAKFDQSLHVGRFGLAYTFPVSR